jgi:hypothetical protein
MLSFTVKTAVNSANVRKLAETFIKQQNVNTIDIIVNECIIIVIVIMLAKMVKTIAADFMNSMVVQELTNLKESLN